MNVVLHVRSQSAVWTVASFECRQTAASLFRRFLTEHSRTLLGENAQTDAASNRRDCDRHVVTTRTDSAVGVGVAGSRRVVTFAEPADPQAEDDVPDEHLEEMYWECYVPVGVGEGVAAYSPFASISKPQCILDTSALPPPPPGQTVRGHLESQRQSHSRLASQWSASCYFVTLLIS